MSLARLRRLAPGAVDRAVGHCGQSENLRSWLDPDPANVEIIGAQTAAPEISVLARDADLPWAGHSAAWAVEDIYRLIAANKTTLVFVNTRAQAEMLFQALWRHNDDNLPIGIHHGSLATEQRRKVEAHMAEGGLRSGGDIPLDLGIDWADIDLVVQVGAPKGTARLLQRIGRSAIGMI